jgi:hypothetical protein
MDIDISRERRRAEFRSLSIVTARLQETVAAVTARPSDESIAGWKIVRVPLSEWDVEIILAESTEPNIVYELPSPEARSGVLTVKRGELVVTYEGLSPSIILNAETPPLILPGGIGRTTFVSKNPCTVFCCLFGGPGENGIGSGVAC